jgi:hypothetical protein
MFKLKSSDVLEMAYDPKDGGVTLVVDTMPHVDINDGMELTLESLKAHGVRNGTIRNIRQDIYTAIDQALMCDIIKDHLEVE